MFESIIVKPDSSSGFPVFHVAPLVDAMLYYGQVNVLASHLELNALLTIFTEDGLYELLNKKRLTLWLNCQHFVPGFYSGKDDIISVGLSTLNIHNVDSLLYNYRMSINNNDNDDAKRFVKKFSQYVYLYEFDNTVSDSMYHEFEDPSFMSLFAKDYLTNFYPEYKQTEDVQMALTPAYGLEGFYKVESNIDTEQLNTIHKNRGVPYSFGYSNLLFGIGNTNMDCYLSAALQSELDIDPRYGSSYRTRMNAGINRIINKSIEISDFSKAEAYGFLSIGEAFEKGTISVDNLLKLLNNRNSVKFREWVASLPPDSHLAGEFVNECEERLKEGNFIKKERLAINLLLTVGSFIAGFNIPAAAGAAWTVLDSFILDKISQGWSPKVFSDKILRNDKLKQ